MKYTVPIPFYSHWKQDVKRIKESDLRSCTVPRYKTVSHSGIKPHDTGLGVVLIRPQTTK